MGEPLNAEVIWGEENLDSLYGQLVANRDGRYYDSQLSFDESKTRLWENLAWDRNPLLRSTVRLKIITEPNARSIGFKKRLPSLFQPICMRTNDIKNVLWRMVSAVIWQKRC
jgi:hypothetical protein